MAETRPMRRWELAVAMKFMVEMYGGSSSVADRSVAALAAGLRSARGIRHLGAVKLPDDETTFHLFEAPDLDTLARLLEAAGVGYDRIAGAITDPSGWPARPDVAE